MNIWVGGVPVIVVGAVEVDVMWTSTIIISMNLIFCLVDFVLGCFELIQCCLHWAHLLCELV